MDDELNLDDLGEDKSKEIITRKDKKINSLSEKLGETEKEKREAAEKAETESKARIEAEKERDFFKGFNPVTSKYPGAGDYQDKIREKVMAGYDVEEATIAILHKEGKLQPIAPTAVQETTQAAGGSASIGITDGVEKTPAQMTQDERRAALVELEAKGELSKIFK